MAQPDRHRFLDETIDEGGESENVIKHWENLLSHQTSPPKGNNEVTNGGQWMRQVKSSLAFKPRHPQTLQLIHSQKNHTKNNNKSKVETERRQTMMETNGWCMRGRKKRNNLGLDLKVRFEVITTVRERINESVAGNSLEKLWKENRSNWL